MISVDVKSIAALRDSAECRLEGVSDVTETVRPDSATLTCCWRCIIQPSPKATPEETHQSEMSVVREAMLGDRVCQFNRSATGESRPLHVAGRAVVCLMATGDPRRRPKSARAAFSGSMKTSVYGRSVRGLPLEVYLPESGKVTLLMIAGFHGAEPEGTVVLSRALRAFEKIPDGVAVILAMNPDGVLLGSRANANGVDLNRNFPSANWQAEPVSYRWTLDDPERVTIGTGSRPGSEPETQALIELIDQLQPKMVVSLHGPLACIDDPNKTPLGRALAQRTCLPLVTDIGYPTPGSFGTWAQERGLQVITYEFPDESVEWLTREHGPVLEALLSGELA